MIEKIHFIRIWSVSSFLNVTNETLSAFLKVWFDFLMLINDQNDHHRNWKLLAVVRNCEATDFYNIFN